MLRPLGGSFFRVSGVSDVWFFLLMPLSCLSGVHADHCNTLHGGNKKPSEDGLLSLPKTREDSQAQSDLPEGFQSAETESRAG